MSEILMVVGGALALIIGGPMFLVYVDTCFDKMRNKTTDVVKSE